MFCNILRDVSHFAVTF